MGLSGCQSMNDTQGVVLPPADERPPTIVEVLNQAENHCVHRIAAHQETNEIAVAGAAISCLRSRPAMGEYSVSQPAIPFPAMPLGRVQDRH